MWNEIFGSSAFWAFAGILAVVVIALAVAFARRKPKDSGALDAEVIPPPKKGGGPAPAKSAGRPSREGAGVVSADVLTPPAMIGGYGTVVAGDGGMLHPDKEAGAGAPASDDIPAPSKKEVELAEWEEQLRRLKNQLDRRDMALGVKFQAQKDSQAALDRYQADLNAREQAIKKREDGLEKQKAVHNSEVNVLVACFGDFVRSQGVTMEGLEEHFDLAFSETTENLPMFIQRGLKDAVAARIKATPATAPKDAIKPPEKNGGDDGKKKGAPEGGKVKAEPKSGENGKTDAEGKKSVEEAGKGKVDAKSEEKAQGALVDAGKGTTEKKEAAAPVAGVQLRPEDEAAILNGKRPNGVANGGANADAGKTAVESAKGAPAAPAPLPAPKPAPAPATVTAPKPAPAAQTSAQTPPQAPPPASKPAAPPVRTQAQAPAPDPLPAPKPPVSATEKKEAPASKVGRLLDFVKTLLRGMSKEKRRYDRDAIVRELKRTPEFKDTGGKTLRRVKALLREDPEFAGLPGLEGDNGNGGEKDE